MPTSLHTIDGVSVIQDDDGRVHWTSHATIDADGCLTTIKAVRRRQLKLPSWEGGFWG